jgi:tetratricopeptide (TPR) repeat protein
MRGYKERGRRRAPAAKAQAAAGDPSTRRSDRRKLSGQEKKLYTESQRLLAAGKPGPAARILEQLSMPREAIQCLEDAGLIHEAAKILMRMQRHNRAGVVYARHGMWDFAAQSFKMANMPLEVAKCYREAGEHAQAAEFFEKAGRAEDAAVSYQQAGDLLRAAKLYSAIGMRDQSMQLLSRLAATAANIAALRLAEEELGRIVDYLGEGHTDANLANVVLGTNKLVEVLLTLISKGLIKQACELFLRATSDIGPQLMAEVNYQDRSAPTLAAVFIAVSNFKYAGMVFERMTAFDQAGEAFERAEDFERAAYCFERAGQEPRARALKEKAQHAPKRLSRAPASAFSLSAVGTEPRLEAAPSDDYDDDDGADENERADDQEATTVLPMPNAKAPAPAPAAPMRLKPTALPVTAPAPIFALQADEPEPLNATDDALPPVSGRPPDEPVTLEEGRAVFHRAKFFDDLDFEQKNKLWTLGTTRSFGPEETILTYNDEPTGVYVIIKGSVSCYRQVGGTEKYVDQMGETETFGELWLLADQPTAVRFVASKASQLRIIERDAFNALLDKDGIIARKVYKRFTMRLLKRLLRPQPTPKNLAS